MAEPDSSVRWQPPLAAKAAPRLLAVLLGLVALTGCAWTVSAGHAWLSLLSGCSRWLVSTSRQADRLEPPSSDQGRRLDARAVTSVTPAAQRVPPLPASATASPPASATAGAAPQVGAQSSWPEPLEYDGATCAGVFVYAVTLDEQAPRWSAVSLATSGGAPGKYARPGQRVEDWEVLSITDDWTGANPVVWLAREDEVCRAHLTGNPARVQAVQHEARQREAQLRRAAQLRKAAQRRKAALRRQRARRRR